MPTISKKARSKNKRKIKSRINKSRNSRKSRKSRKSRNNKDARIKNKKISHIDKNLSRRSKSISRIYKLQKGGVEHNTVQSQELIERQKARRKALLHKTKQMPTMQTMPTMPTMPTMLTMQTMQTMPSVQSMPTPTSVPNAEIISKIERVLHL